jgi:glucose-6-phosphate isomerase
MVHVDLTKARSFLEEDQLKSAQHKAATALGHVQKGDAAGAEWLGWRRILAEPNDAELEQIDTLAEELRREVDVLVVCGIGGSYLGSKALIEALTPAFKTGSEIEILFAGHNISGPYLKQLIEYLEVPKDDSSPKQVAVNVISKSGSTLETALSFRVLRKWMHRRFPGEAADRIVCTTGQDGGVLNPLADEHGYKKFTIPDDVGGRFSVLTPVGLFPAAMAGIDIRTLFYEAVAKYEELEDNADELLNYAALRYAFEVQGKAIDLITSFEPELHGFSQWLQQLLGESEGKEGRGIFPVVAQYSADLHSLGQFMQQGAEHMIETFIEVKESGQRLKVEEDDSEDGLDYLEGKSFHEINQKALEATRKAHVEGNVPCITVSIDEKNAQNFGEFIYFFELFDAVYCYMLGVNPFNQPGVEDYKKEMYNLLGK